MTVAESVPTILVLEDGRVFRGSSFGAVGECFGEAVFSTGMSGYQETLTDPSYHRQVVVATAPHIGNTGWNDEDDESSRIWVAGYVVRDPARLASSWRARRSLDEELVTQQIVGIKEVDTRALTRHLRERGAMRVGISSLNTDADALLQKVRESPSMLGANLVDDVSTTEPYVIPAAGQKRFTVAAMDLGIKTMTPAQMAQRGIEVHVLPANTTAAQIRQLKPDGVFFSNGPGDPAAAEHATALLRELLGDGLPFFGICFGNQIFGRALGFGTHKLKYGHRGINQPVMDRTTGKVEITAHNHGFAVDAPADEVTHTEFGDATVSHLCLNDGVVEGLELHRDGRLVGYSVQYHPEAAAGPHDANHLFDRFLDVLLSNTSGGGTTPLEPPAAARRTGSPQEGSPASQDRLSNTSGGGTTPLEPPAAARSSSAAGGTTPLEPPAAARGSSAAGGTTPLEPPAAARGSSVAGETAPLEPPEGSPDSQDRSEGKGV